MAMIMPTADQLERGQRAFQAHESRDPMYEVATFLLRHHWGNAEQMANGLGVLLLTWNQALYRYGSFDFDKLQDCIALNKDILEYYRSRSILQYTMADDPHIKSLFDQFLQALAIAAKGTRKGARSPVAVAKALHLLAPSFFPLWDKKIAQAYGCDYSLNPAAKYLAFLKALRLIAQNVRTINTPGKTLLKVIDEYNYSRYTKGWV